ncbi:MAG TPA: zinc ABC transporter substrate-binding protein, partial [Plasticicumulans sp.]|nr:zinc ABC transporter substrate-binding protein [Plasticicumulans sp.]
GADHEGGVEPHIWLDPRNARTMTARIAEVLISRDGANAATYRANAAKLDAGLAALDAGLAQQLAPLAGKPFIVFHDAYQYFEHRYGLTAVGSITVSPERKPSAQRIQAVRDRIRETGARCVFAEPQFDSALVATLTEGTGARAGSLDPTGADGVPAGPDAYAQVLRRLAENLGACLGG